MIKLSILISFLLNLTRTQEQWETQYQSFQDTNTMDTSGWIISGNYNGLQLSTCNGVTMFGGFNAFGTNTIISKHFSLPPHYQIKVSLEFWKIDSWDAEYLYILIDDYVSSRQCYFSVGTQLCGNSGRNDWLETIIPITLQMNHNSEFLMIIMTSSLNEAVDTESWGFRDFKLQVVKCPSGCLFCSDNDYYHCYLWIKISSLSHESMLLDGWMKNDIIQPTTYQCVSFNLINLTPNDKLENIIENLRLHDKMQISFQLWQIDSWNNENFQLYVDDQLQKQIVLSTTGTYSICGSAGLEKVFNIAVTFPHTSSECKITMKTNHNAATTNAYWGIRAFNLFISNACFKGCDECISLLKTGCTVCSSGWVFYTNLCIYPSPMLGITIRITQIKDPKSHERIPMEINLLETNQQIVTQGTFTYTINNNISILNIRVYAKCYPNKNEKLFYKVHRMLTLKLILVLALLLWSYKFYNLQCQISINYRFRIKVDNKYI